MGIWLGETGFLYNWTEWKCKLVIQPLKHRISWDIMMGFFLGYKTSVIFFESENVVLWFNQSKRWFNGILMGMEWDSDGIPYGNVRVCDKSPFSVMISLEKMVMFLAAMVDHQKVTTPVFCSGYYLFPSKSGWWFGTFSIFPYIENVIIPTD